MAQSSFAVMPINSRQRPDESPPSFPVMAQGPQDGATLRIVLTAFLGFGNLFRRRRPQSHYEVEALHVGPVASFSTFKLAEKSWRRKVVSARTKLSLPPSLPA